MNLQVDGSVLGAGDSHLANSALIIKASCTEICVGRGLPLVAGLGAVCSASLLGLAWQKPMQGPNPCLAALKPFQSGGHCGPRREALTLPACVTPD